MSTVYVTQHGAHFHVSMSCRWITIGQRAKRSSAPIHAVEISDIHGLSPCRSCYPDAPRARFLKRRCAECNTAHPCAHNGGILVYTPRVWRKGSALLAPGTVTYRKRYVWPDVAHLYEPVVDPTKV